MEPGLGDWMMQMIPGYGQTPPQDPNLLYEQLPQSPNVESRPPAAPDPLWQHYPDQQGQAAPQLQYQAPPNNVEIADFTPPSVAYQGATPSQVALDAGIRDIGKQRLPRSSTGYSPADRLGMMLEWQRMDDPLVVQSQYMKRAGY